MRYTITGEMKASVSGDYFVKTGSFPVDLSLSANYTAHCGFNVAPDFKDIQLSPNGFRFHIDIPSGEVAQIIWNFSVE
jgi:hypothetical protein